MEEIEGNEHSSEVIFFQRSGFEVYQLYLLSVT